jgi:hypothetical protein
MLPTLQRLRVRVEFGGEFSQPPRTDRVIHGTGKLPHSVRLMAESKVRVRVHGDAWLGDGSRRPCSRGLKYSIFDPRQTST